MKTDKFSNLCVFVCVAGLVLFAERLQGIQWYVVKISIRETLSTSTIDVANLYASSKDEVCGATSGEVVMFFKKFFFTCLVGIVNNECKGECFTNVVPKIFLAQSKAKTRQAQPQHVQDKRR